MIQLDEIIFGDNQFFGINHMSQEKAQQLSEHFFNINKIFSVYQMAFDAGIRAIMLNSNDRSKDICKYFKTNSNIYHDMAWYPSIPYPHKYANLIAEKGIFPTINEVLFRGNTTMGAINMLSKGSIALFSKDIMKMMQMLIDVEMKMFNGLNVKVVFLQNIITDLMLGFNVKEVFYEYCDYIRKKYHAIPGLITLNMPYLKKKLAEWEIKDVVICTSFNKIGYLMSPNLDSYIEAANNNNPIDYPIIAMSTLASGAISAKDAFEFINRQNIQSVVFGASSYKNINESVKSIKLSHMR